MGIPNTKWILTDDLLKEVYKFYFEGERQGCIKY